MQARREPSIPATMGGGITMTQALYTPRVHRKRTAVQAMARRFERIGNREFSGIECFLAGCAGGIMFAALAITALLK